MLNLKYKLFDGEKLWDGAAVTVEHGIITSVQKCSPEECGNGILMPGLIDAHVHMEIDAHVAAMLHSGITAVCDVSASERLIKSSKQLEIVSSAGMAMGIVVNPKGYVEKAAANGAKYIKVLLFNTLSIGKPALHSIVTAAHNLNLKVAVHATEVATARQAVEANADILLHVPMKEAFPMDLAENIAKKNIAVAPTLVMMKTFAHSGKNGYKITDYQNAEHAVKLLHDCGVSILAGTDANPGNFAPAVDYGNTLHDELNLLVNAGLTPIEALTAATCKNAEAFSINAGKIAPGRPASMLLVDAALDKDNIDITNLKQIWINGETIL